MIELLTLATVAFVSWTARYIHHEMQATYSHARRERNRRIISL